MLLRSLALLATSMLLVSAPEGAEHDPGAVRSMASRPPPPFAPGEQIDVAIDYLHVRTGQATLIVGRPEGTVWPVICQARTDGAANGVDVREHYVTYWDADSGATRGFDLTAIERGDRHLSRGRFDRETGKAKVQVVRKGSVQESTYDVPRDVEDFAGALLRLRREPLAPGDHAEFPVLSGKTVFTLTADVEGTEAIDTPAGKFETVKVRVRFAEGPKTSRDAHLWFSSDARHIPVRASAELAVGSVTAIIVGYRPGTPFASATTR